MVVGDTDHEFNKALTAALFPIGLRDISVCTDGKQLRDAIATTVDVVVCTIDLPGVEFHALAQDIRHQRIAGNPFIVLIATTNRVDEASMTRILESGVDDLIVKPVDSATFVRRVGAFAKGRKPFVITPGFIGPTRRPTRREDGSDDEVFEVPNTIRAKVAQRQSAAEVNKLVETGLSSLGEKMAQGGIKVIAPPDAATGWATARSHNGRPIAPRASRTHQQSRRSGDGASKFGHSTLCRADRRTDCSIVQARGDGFDGTSDRRTGSLVQTI